ncbi:MAG: YcjF family protein [Congregibacter sp.]
MTTATADATEVEEYDVHHEAAKIIASSVKWSAAAAVIPVPFLDLAALGAVQVKMVRSLATAYDKDPNSQSLQGVISALLGTLVPTVASGALVGPSLKWAMPGVGSLLGSVSIAAFGSASTYAIGKVFVKHFDNGGTLDDFSAESVEADLKGEFDSAKARAGAKK